MNKYIKKYLYSEGKVQFFRVIFLIFLGNFIIVGLIIAVIFFSGVTKKTDAIYFQIENHTIIKNEIGWVLPDKQVIIEIDTAGQTIHEARLLASKPKSVVIELWYQNQAPEYMIDSLVIIKTDKDYYKLRRYVISNYKSKYSIDF